VTDAIAIGAESALADDPALTARRGARVVHRPVRVVLDSRLRVPPRARLFREDAARTWVVCSSAAPVRRRRALEARGARVLALRPARDGRPPIRAVLERLAAEGIGTLLVEGGGTLAAALLRAGLVDDLVWFAAPLLLGGDARPAVGPLALARLAAAPRLVDPRVRRIGADWLVEARLAPTAAGRARR